MSKKEEKAKVGRPKLADKDLIKDSWCRIAASLSIVIVMIICGVGVLTTRTPWQVLTFKSSDNLKANVVSANNVKDSNSKNNDNVKIIKAKKVTTKIIGTDGKITYIIPAK